jgi:hypothetical protein
VGERQIVLEQDADPAALRRQVSDLDVAEADPSSGRECRIEGAADEGEQARFAATAGAHYGRRLARRHAAGERRNQQAVAEPDENALQNQCARGHERASQRRAGRARTKPNGNNGSTPCTRA